MCSCLYKIINENYFKNLKFNSEFEHKSKCICILNAFIHVLLVYFGILKKTDNFLLHDINNYYAK